MRRVRQSLAKTIAGFVGCCVASIPLMMAPIALAKEKVSGDDEAPREADGMHACSVTGIVTGINTADNWLLCLEFGTAPWSSARVTDGSDQVPIPAGTRGGGSTMLACRHAEEFVAGVHLASNRLRCVRLNGPTAGFLTRETPPIPVTRRGLRFVEFQAGADAPRLATCPRGYALVGLHMQHQLLACAMPPVCESNAECRDRGAGSTCRYLRSGVNVMVCRP
jgi:hypothetical protein